jgi:hypothetical protein
MGLELGWLGMMSSRIVLSAAVLALACATSIAPAWPQSLAEIVNPDRTEIDQAAAPGDEPEIDWSLLDVDAGTLLDRGGPQPRSAKRAADASGLSWSGHAQKDGAGAVSVKQPLSPFWDTRAGADMTVAPDDATPMPGETAPQSSGSAWVAMTAPGVGSVWDQTAVEARLDPLHTQTKLGTSLSKSLPLGQSTALTLQNGGSVVQQSLAPPPGAPPRTTRNFATDQTAKLSLTDTGTSLIAGQSLSTTDDKWLRKVGAEQKIFGDVSIAGSVGETPAGTLNRSITAGFKHSW